MKKTRRWPIVLGVLLALVAGLVIALAATSEGFATFGGTPSAASLARIEASPRHRDGVFVNEEPTSVMKEGGASSSLEFFFGGGDRSPRCPLPLKDSRAALATPPSSGLRVTWLGHSTTLLELDGVRVLTDPMWSLRASPSTLAGPKRFHPPPLPIDALPKLDAVLISHDHYDHLDVDTVRTLARTGVTFHVGLGVGAHLERWGVPTAQIVEHDPWQASALPGGVRLVSTPARHFSGRGLVRNHTLWTSWVLAGPKHRVFFSGDTGLTEAFRSIAAKEGPFNLALLEIGQAHPSWGDIHLGPHKALEAQVMLGAKALLPIHWATFELALHPWSEPAETLSREAPSKGVALLTPLLGEAIEPATAQTGPWWRRLPPLAKDCP